MSSEERLVYPKAEVTLDGLYNLLAAVQEAMPNTPFKGEFYRTQEPAESVRKDIIDNANKGAMLSHVGASTISMVVLDQLPMLTANCEDSCLVPDSLLLRPPATVTEQSIRSQIHPTSQGFWSRLYDHFIHLMKYKVMDVDEIASTFGVLLISAESPYEAKAIQLLKDLLENISPDEIPDSPASSDTFSSMALSPRRSSSKSHVQQKETIDEENIKPNPNESAAYQRMLTGTGTMPQTITYEDSDDSDDIENQLTGGMKSKTMSPRQPPPSAPSPTPDKSEAADDVSETSTPALSTGGGGYVPSALANTGKSTLTNTSLGSTGKKAATSSFMYGDSDTDEDVEVPGTKPNTSHGAEDDDFDFYG